MKNKTFSALEAIKYTLTGIVLIFSLVACNYDKTFDLQITAQSNITSYLETNSNQFSTLLELLNRDVTLTNGKTIKYGSFLNAYGAYTLFAPTNDAFTAYFAEKGISSASDLTSEQVAEILNFHVLQDTISTTNFTDGKLGVATMYGLYLVTNSSYNGSVTRILVNKQAYIIDKNIKLGNGIVQVIDNVLKPAELTSAKMIENDSRFKIFTAALKATGYYDSLNVVSNDVEAANRRWLTVMATPDSVYNAMGINSYEALKSKYCHTGDPTNPKDSLFLYIGYHIVNGLRFIADLTASTTYATLTPNQVISISYSADTVLINELTINGKLERGVAIQRYKSDLSSINGVWHILKGDYYIKIRKISRVFFDFSDYSDIRTKVSYWGQPYSGTISSTPFMNGKVQGIQVGAVSAAAALITYNPTKSEALNGKNFYVNYNNITIVNRTVVGALWAKFTTPFIAAGTYKVWLSFRTTGYTTPVDVMIDSIPMTVPLDFLTYLPGRGQVTNKLLDGYKTLEAYDNYLQGLGYKRPVQIHGQTKYAHNVMVGKYLGKVTLTTSSTHWIKFTSTITGRSGTGSTLDYMEFIPVDEDQIWPKYDQDGTAYPRPPDGYDDFDSAIY
jgi:uncharacterized surface protein with fasciclin (FAS1) repeats